MNINKHSDNKGPRLLKIGRRAKSALVAVVATGALVAAVSATVAADDLKFGDNIHELVDIFRELNVSYVDPVDSQDLMETAAAAMTQTLDPYTSYIPKSEVSDFEFMTTGKYGGIGALIRTKGEYTVISEPYKDSPSDKAGLKAGDIIMAIDGKSIKNFESSKVSEMMKGTAGTKVELTIRRLVDGREVIVPITRDHIVVSGIRYYGMVSDSVGLIIHNSFTEDCSRDLRNAFVDLKNQGAKSLIIDLRNNGGGLLNEAVDILSIFVDKGTQVVSMRGRSKQSHKTFTTKTPAMDTQIPIAVLVNNSSASASEIVSGAIQDLDRGVIVGTRTFGKGLVQSTVGIGTDSYLKLTTAKYYTPSGRCIQAIDYSHRNSDGLASNVPDSLIKEFETVGGRKVYDGGGIMPDIQSDNKFISEFSANLYGLGYIEDFANDFYRRHSTEDIDPSFELSDEEYGLFASFLADKDIEFRSRSSYLVDQLRKAIDQDTNIESLDEQLEIIEAAISPDKKDGLERYRQELSEIIEGDIVRRFCYGWGAAESSLRNDTQLKAAIEILSDPQEYNRLRTQVDLKAK